MGHDPIPLALYLLLGYTLPFALPFAAGLLVRGFGSAGCPLHLSRLRAALVPDEPLVVNLVFQSLYV